MRKVETVQIRAQVNEQVQDIPGEITAGLRMDVAQGRQFLLELLFQCLLSECEQELFGQWCENQTDLALSNILFGLGFGQGKMHPDVTTFDIRLLLKISHGSLNQSGCDVLENDWL